VILAKGLNIHKGYLSRLIKKLDLHPLKIRGKKNQWSFVFEDKDVESLLEYRIGIPHSLKKTKNGYKIC